ncbi:hypothetical protein BDV29DRAFT_166627 [Aspergillus leporis]|uniref:Uncharacterized protein n=1 Tax=Aspergillus leporis TaxID=41062 RepID=A0A5N5XBN4_9EURO|nr:hypothetical protein BDV29DRAFT_166627 [Aspergillus leporis]
MHIITQLIYYGIIVGDVHTWKRLGFTVYRSPIESIKPYPNASSTAVGSISRTRKK